MVYFNKILEFVKANALIVGLSSLVIILALTLAAKSAELSDLPKMQKEMFEPSVQLGKFCSGTVVYSDRDKETGDVNTIVLTAKHCTNKVDERIPVVISSYNKHNREVSSTSFNSKVLGMSYKSDLALLKLDDKETVFVPATVASKDITLEFGQDIWSVSYPLGFSKTLTVGALGYVENIPSLSSLSSSSEYYRSTPDVAPGSSGSALFAKEAGKFVVIGTLTAQFNGFPFVNLYTPIEEIQEYLDTAKRSYEVNTEEQTTLKGKN